MTALWHKFLCWLIGVSCVISPLAPTTSPVRDEITLGAANTKIRQEISILDSYLTAASSALATSSEIVLLTDSYTGPTYYFEVLASTTAATDAKITL